MTTLPEKLAEKTMYGQMIGSALSVMLIQQERTFKKR